MRQSWSAAATGEDQTSQTGEEANYPEADFFQPDPVVYMTAQEAGHSGSMSAFSSDTASATVQPSGEAYHDPFDPDPDQPQYA